MTISNILEHWATIYKPLSHKPEATRIEEQSFFRIRYIDLENTFSRNANLIHSPCMLHSITSTGELKNARQAEVNCQVWFLAKVADTVQSLGRFDGIKLENTANALREYCEDLIAWMIEVRKTGVCPVTKRDFHAEPRLLQELQSIDIESVNYGVLPDIYGAQWLVAGMDWHSVKPLYTFSCGSCGKYAEPDTEIPEPHGEKE